MHVHIHTSCVGVSLCVSDIRPVIKGGAKGAYESPSSTPVSPYSLELRQPCTQALGALTPRVVSESRSRNACTCTRVPGSSVYIH